MLHLILAGPAGTDNRTFYCSGRILMHPKPVGDAGSDRHPTRLPELQRGINVAGQENLFNRQHLGLMLFNELAD